MMIRANKPFYGIRFCAGTITNIGHDLLAEKANCGIDNIYPNLIRMYNNKDELSTNYRPCKFCLAFDQSFP